METDTTQRLYTEQYLQRFANGCSLSVTPSAPGSGDCGFHLLAYTVAKSPFLLDQMNLMRKNLGVTPLNLGEGTTNPSILKDMDITFYIRSLYSQTSIYEESPYLDLDVVDTFDRHLRDVFDEEGNIKWAELAKYKLLNLKPQIKDNGVRAKKAFQRKDNYVENMELADLSATYAKLVVNYFRNFSMDLPKDAYKTFLNCCEKYFAMPPSIVGRMGCKWADNEVLSWFELFFQVKIFICNPS